MGWQEPSRRCCGGVLASRAPWPPALQGGSVPSRSSAKRIAWHAYHGPSWAFWKCAVLFCRHFNLNYPGKSAATQVAGMEVRHRRSLCSCLGSLWEGPRGNASLQSSFSLAVSSALWPCSCCGDGVSQPDKCGFLNLLLSFNPWSRDEENFCATVPKDGRSYSPMLFAQTVRVLKKINKPGNMIVSFSNLAERIKVRAGGEFKLTKKKRCTLFHLCISTSLL